MRVRWPARLAAATMTAVLLLAAPATARDPHREVWIATELAIPAGAPPFSSAVNSRGQVAGWGFVWEDGVTTDLAIPYWSHVVDINDRGTVLVATSGPSTQDDAAVVWRPGRQVDLGLGWVHALNNRGQVAGYHLQYPPGGDLEHTIPFLWTAGVFAWMEPVPGWEPHSSHVVDLNDRGQVLGEASSEEDFHQAFVWDRTGVRLVGNPSTRLHNNAVDLNERGVVLGDDAERGAYLWDDGDVTFLGSMAEGDRTVPVAVNDRGQVAGYSRSAGTGREVALVWWRGRFTALTPPDGTASRPTALNNRGQVVGTLERPQPGGGTVASAFVWQDGTLTELSVPWSGTAFAHAISDRGHIIGGGTDTEGRSRGVLWTKDRGTRQ